MPISINGTGSITGLSAGGLPDGSITAADLASGAARSNFGAGAVLQVVSTTKTDVFSSTTAQGTFVDVTGLSLSITPASASNKILVFGNVSMGVSTGQYYCAIRILRDSTSIAIADTAGSRVRATIADQPAADTSTSNAFSFLDSPATTSSITYKLQLTGETGQTKYINRSQESDNNEALTPRSVSSITLMEIAG